MEILRVEIPQHIRKVQFSARQRPVYFEWTGVAIKGKRAKLHKRYFKDSTNIPEFPKIEHLKDKFYIGMFVDNKLQAVTRDSAELPSVETVLRSKIKYRLVVKDEADYVPLLCNPNQANTPKMVLIKGQGFYDGSIREHMRGTIMEAIKSCYKPYLVDLPVIEDYPVRIECEIHETIKNVFDNKGELGRPWDIDNYAYPYMKAFPDLMQKLGKLKNDDRLHLTQPPSPIFVPVKTHEERKLVFIISKDDREIIANNEIYKDFHSGKPGIAEQIQNNQTFTILTKENLTDIMRDIVKGGENVQDNF